MAIFFSWWYFTAKMSGIEMCIPPTTTPQPPPFNIESGWFWWRGIQYIPISPHAAFCSQCGILSMTTPLPPPRLPPAPPVHPNSFASTDDISKESLAMYEAGLGGWGDERGTYLDKTGPQSGHGPKGQSLIHVKVAGGVCACVCVVVGVWGGQHGVAKEAYLKAGVYLKRSGTTKLVILQIRPVTSSLVPPRARRRVMEKGFSVLCGTACGARGTTKPRHEEQRGDHRRGFWCTKENDFKNPPL